MQIDGNTVQLRGGIVASREIAPIQILRAAAALSVAMLHVLGAAGALVGTPGQAPWPELADAPWEAGVDVFFVISGFVMVHSSRPLFGRAGAPATFVARRVARVVPLYWIVTTAFVLLAVVWPHAFTDPLGGPATVFASYLFLPWQREDGSMLPVFRLGWTLNYEMLFYCVFALFVALPRRRAVAGVAATIGLLVLMHGALLSGQPALAFWTDPIMLEFLIGMFLATALQEGITLQPPRRWLLALAGLLMLAANGTHWGLHRVVAFGLPAGCLVGAAMFVPPGRPASFLLRGLARLGAASYALYLVHLFAVRTVREVWAGHQFDGVPYLPSFVLASLAAAILAALAVHRLIELPATQAVRRVLGAGRNVAHCVTV
jgi:peptidoglycan/LPS O-acetylase OafA/YrhL